MCRLGRCDYIAGRSHPDGVCTSVLFLLVISYAMLIATIIFGLIGYLQPRKTMEMLHLKTDGQNDGLSEVRGASGALFIAISVAALIFGGMATAMVGIAYAGAAVGRITAIILDKAGSRTTILFFCVEVIFAAWLIWAGFAQLGRA